ncbi:MAG: glycoside hydrolase family 9 protein [Gemmatimonadaceae bacterium]|nr:glycoside hydrolase family 9 protein [Gemmatimonadaceae bacterium]
MRSGAGLGLILGFAAFHVAAGQSRSPQAGSTQRTYIRINQLGYLPSDPKIAVTCSLEAVTLRTFTIQDSDGRLIFGPAPAKSTGSFGPCASTHRLDFSTLRKPGRYTILASGVASPPVFVSSKAYDDAANTLLVYMRQQRSGFNPIIRDSVHRLDGIIVDDPARAGQFINVSGGWADASDYLQYVTTSANATFVMLMAYRDNPRAFSDRFDARGLPGANTIPDVLDEARHGLEWLLRMYPADDRMYNQLGDDRDHAVWDLPWTDSSNYGWGKGKQRPVYPCTGKPQGIVKTKNRSTGYASTAGKFASAFAIGATIFRKGDPAFADTLKRKAFAAYRLGRQHPGVCQTAPGGQPYFYEEDNWHDDMELAAASLVDATGRKHFLGDALAHARNEKVTPWMGRDTARHYQWYPWHNNGHYEAWRHGSAGEKAQLASFYKTGLKAVAARAGNGFRVGIPFIWCSNNLMASFATQAYLYRRMTADNQFREYEAAALDWLLGANPWGVSMIIGLPQSGNFARDPHSVIAKDLKLQLTGGLLDGPVYRSIYKNLLYVNLHDPDEYAAFNTGFIVYHDDVGDYSTNEPIMDGTANLSYLFAAMAGQ